MRVSSLHVYPVKSVAPCDLTEATVEPWGLRGDRRWMVVDPDGAQMTGRERRPLLGVSAETGDATLTLARAGASPLVLDTEHLTGPQVAASVWKTGFSATDAGPEAAAWFSALLDEPARLVYLDDPTARPVTNEAIARPGDVVSMADAFPLLLTSEASLRQLNDWIVADHPDDAPSEPLVMRRFRPNVVVDGEVPFAEDAWLRIQIGAVIFRGGGACARCVMTTVDPFTLHGGKEPIRTMAKRRGWDRKTWFGLNLIPETVGEIRIGDGLTVLE